MLCLYFLRTLAGHHDTVRAIAAYAYKLVSESCDSIVSIWKISTASLCIASKDIHRKVYSVVLDHKRNRCISKSKDNIVQVWCFGTGAELFNLGATCLSYSCLVSTTTESTLRILNPENGYCRSTFDRRFWRYYLLSA
jgi:F-box and WD-40 domain protein CDC4